MINVHDYCLAGWAQLQTLIRDDSVANTVIHLTANDTITLNGVHAADLHVGDFIV